MFEKIVLAVDGSPSSAAAVHTATGFAAKTGAEVEVVHVREHDVIPSRAGSGPDLETPVEAQELLSGVVDTLREAGVTAHGTLLHSQTREVARTIIDTADVVGADLIVVGSRGLSPLSSALLGSVSSKLIHDAGRPVLVAHERN